MAVVAPDVRRGTGTASSRRRAPEEGGPVESGKREAASELAALLERLQRAKAAGLAHLEEIIAQSTEATPAIRREYLTQSIAYDLGEAEKQGLGKFQQYLVELKLVAQHELRFIP